MADTFITIDILSAISGKKTSSWSVNTTGGTRLGVIQWFSPWRRYCFYPAPDTIYDTNCLDKIASFCMTETTKQKERK